MVKIDLPVITKNEIKDGKHIVEYGDKEFLLDVSLVSQMRWERKFPTQASKEDLESFTERISKVEASSIGVILSKMKVLYCYFDTNLTFEQFMQMFDLSNLEFTKKLTNKLTETFNIIFGEASEKN